MTKKQVKKETIEKFVIVKQVDPKTKTVEELHRTTLIIAKKGRAVYCLEQTWAIAHIHHYYLSNMYTHKIRELTETTRFHAYLNSLIDLGYELTCYYNWDDALDDLGIVIPPEYKDN